MELILAVQPDLERLPLLRVALKQLPKDVEIVVADSTEAALSAIDKHVPDVVLLHTLMRPTDQDYLTAYLRALPNADHVQTLAIPLFHVPSAPPDARRPRHSWFDALKWEAVEGADLLLGCDPRSFAADVVAYLARAREIKRDQQQWTKDRASATSDRRREERRTPVEVPRVMSVRLAEEDHADLVNVSSHGALVRTRTRPPLSALKSADLDARHQPGVTFRLESGAEVHAAGRVVRCHIVAPERGRVIYEVAFRFDESVCLDFLPAVQSSPPGPAGHEWTSPKLLRS